MELGVLIDVSISIIVVMILFSLVATAINEVIVDNIFRLRGRRLRDAIGQLLEAERSKIAEARGQQDTEGKTETRTLTDLFFDTEQIKRLTRQGKSGKVRRLPSAIAPRSYALALLDLTGETEKLKETAEQEAKDLNTMVQNIATAGPVTRRVDVAGEAVNTYIAGFRTTLDRRIDALEADFTEMMDRVQGWYLRRVRVNLFVIGLVLAVGANVDLMRYANRLMTEDNLATRTRAAIDLGSELRTRAEQDDRSTPGPNNTGPNNTDPDDTGPDDSVLDSLDAQLGAEVGRLIDGLDELEVQIGWTCETIPDTTPADAGQAHVFPAICEEGSAIAVPATILGLMSLLSSWILVAFGVTLGAQFWFDLFKKLVDLRTAGKVSTTASKS